MGFNHLCIFNWYQSLLLKWCNTISNVETLHSCHFVQCNVDTRGCNDDKWFHSYTSPSHVFTDFTLTNDSSMTQMGFIHAKNTYRSWFHGLSSWCGHRLISKESQNLRSHKGICKIKNLVFLMKNIMFSAVIIFLHVLLSGNPFELKRI